MSNSYTYTQEESNFDLLKDGDYEVVIEKIDFATLPSGKEKMQIRYRIRKDVDQSYGNRLMFEDIWKEAKNPNFFNRVRLNKLLGTQSVKDGQVFESIEDIKNFLLGKYLQLHIITTHDDYHNENINTISYYKKTEHPDSTLEVDINSNGEAVQEISDEELPF